MIDINKREYVTCPTCGMECLNGACHLCAKKSPAEIKEAKRVRHYDHRDAMLPICKTNECGHYTYEGKNKCAICPSKPCNLEYHLIQGKGCPADPPMFGPVEIKQEVPVVEPSRLTGWLSWEEFRRDIEEFSSRLAGMNLDGIAGIPRSGAVVASEIAVRLGLTLYSFAGGQLTRLDNGRRLEGRYNAGRRILILDDSSFTGASISEARERLGYHTGGLLYGAVYATIRAADHLDVHHRTLEEHTFAHHLFGCEQILSRKHAGTDWDGVLGPDFTSDEDDDGPRYRQRMSEMPVLNHPGAATVPFILTARLEKYREESERWLTKHRIKYGELIMGPWMTKGERAGNCVGSWKAEQIKENGIQMFFESDERQAKIIAERTSGVHVICPKLGAKS